MSVGAIAVAVGFPPVVALVAYLIGIGVPLVASVRTRAAPSLLRSERVGRALLALAVVAAFADRHLLASSSRLAPDDLAAAVAVAAIILVPGTPRWRAVAVGLALAAYVLVAATLISVMPYGSDAVVGVHGGAELIVSGRHPYADFDMERELGRFGLGPVYATALEDGSRIRTLNYPALAVVAPAPFIAAGLADVRPLFLAEVLALFALVVLSVAPPLRLLALAVAIGNVVVLDQFVVAGVDPLWALLCAGAWLARSRTGSAVLLGLAVADRQPAWLIAPFLLVWAAQERGPREAALRAAITGAVALAVHVPFLLTAPGAVVGGITDIILLPLVPHGIGPAGVGLPLPIPRGLFFAAAALAYAVALWAYATRRVRGRGAAFVLPLASLWLSRRALQGYFACIPLLSILEERDRTYDRA